MINKTQFLWQEVVVVMEHGRNRW